MQGLVSAVVLREQHEAGWEWKMAHGRCSDRNDVSVLVHDLVSAPWALAAAQEVHEKSTPLGRAVVLDNSTKLIPLWNADVEDGGFPRWQDQHSGQPIDPDEYRRVGAAGAPFMEWLGCLGEPHRADQPARIAQGPDRDQSLRIGGIENVPPGGELVAAVNSVQSNFLAPYDFLVAGGRVVRQGYAASSHGFGTEGEWCWVFALEGGAPRIVSVRVSSADNHDRILEQRPAIHPSRARLAPAEDGAVEHVQGDAATCQEEMRAGVSGLPLLLGGEKVLPPLVEDCIMFRSLPPVRLHLVEG
jgi:hypothetical protein